MRRAAFVEAGDCHRGDSKLHHVVEQYSAVLADDHTRTLPVAVYGFLSFGAFDWGALTAAATLITIPVMTLALLIQRHIVGGLAMGAVKG